MRRSVCGEGCDGVRLTVGALTLRRRAAVPALPPMAVAAPPPMEPATPAPPPMEPAAPAPPPMEPAAPAPPPPPMALVATDAGEPSQETQAPAPQAVARTVAGRRVVPRAALTPRCDLVQAEELVDRDRLLQGLVEGGYLRVPVVEDPGTFAARGASVGACGLREEEPQGASSGAHEVVAEHARLVETAHRLGEIEPEGERGGEG